MIPELTDEQRKVLSRILAVVAFGCIGMAALLGADIKDEVCGKPENITRYVCYDGVTVVGNPDNCPITTTLTTTLPATTTTPTTSILVTTLPATTSLMPSFCTGRDSGSYCDKKVRVECSGGVEIDQKSCEIVMKPVWKYPEGKKPSIEYKPVPGVCHENSEGADCCEEAICG